MSSPTTPISETLFNAMRRFTRASYASNKTISSGELSRPEWHLMWLLKNWPEPKGAQPSRLALGLQVTAGNVTQQLRRLEGQSLVERTHDDSDRRVVLIKLTSEGEAMLNRVRGEFIELFDSLAATLGPRDSEKFISLLLCAAEHLEQKGAASC